MKALIPERINNKLDEIVTKCFEGNRIADRAMSVLNIKFVMNKTEEILHEKLAHLYPQLADRVSTYQSSRNNLTFYGMTPADNSDYTSPLEFFEKMVNYMIELESLIGEGVELSRSEDTSTYAFLLSFTGDVGKVTEQCLLLLDKAEQYKDKWESFDQRIESFVIL